MSAAEWNNTWAERTPAQWNDLSAEEAILPTSEGDEIVILNEDATRVEHHLDRDLAIAFAQRLLMLSRSLPEQRPLIRPADVDERLRALDD